ETTLGIRREPVTFEDVMMFLDRAEWDALPEGQRQLYRDVVEQLRFLVGTRTGLFLQSHGCGESGFLAWLVTFAVFPSGHTGSWLEEPSSGWWPETSGYQEPETSYPGESCSLLLQLHPWATPTA
uniref:KRAB domain-containing protein n=1 Tax=Ficedula albicollis TaxID=59894 RepID=A0A803VR82_FICAL